MDLKWKSCMRIAITALLALMVVRYWDEVEGFIGLLLNGLLAIFAGLVISYIVNIPMRFYERVLPGESGDGTKNRMFSLVLAFVSIVAVLLFVAILVVPQLVNAVVTLAVDAPTIMQTITGNEFVKMIVPADFLTQLEGFDWSQLVSDVAVWLQSGLVGSIPQITSVIGRIGACFMGIILAFWFLSEKDGLSLQAHLIMRTYIGESFEEWFSRSTKLADECFHGYLVGQSLEAVIFGSIVAVASMLFGLPYGPMLGALVGAMSLIPMIGALIGAILGALIIFATSWQQALIFLIVFFVVQQIEANLIYPRVVGKHVGLTGMWPLVGITLGTALFGIVGAFVGVPMTAVIFRLVENDLERRSEQPDANQTPLKKLQKSLSD